MLRTRQSCRVLTQITRQAHPHRWNACIRVPTLIQHRAIGSVSAIDSVIFRNLFGIDEIRNASHRTNPLIHSQLAN